MSEYQFLNPDMTLESFRDSLATPEKRQSLYKFLEEQQWADIPYEEFEAGILPDLKKKPTGGQDSSQPSLSSDAPIAGEPATPGSLLEETPVESTRTAFKERGLAIPDYTGEEDPIQAGAAIRERKEKPRNRVLESDISKGNRELEDIVSYAKELNIQANLAKEGLADEFGPDWEDRLNKSVDIIQNADPNTDGFNESKQFVSQIQASKHFGSLNAASIGLGKSEESFTNYAKNNPGYAEDIETAKKQQELADKTSLTTDPYYLQKRLFSWYTRKTAQVGASVLSLPRTLIGAVPMGDQPPGVHDYLGGIADLAVEKSNLYFPAQTENQRPLWEKTAKIKLDGEEVEAVVQNGEVVRVYAKNNQGNLVEINPDEEDMAVIQQEAPAKAESRFTGWENTGAKALDVGTDLLIMRALSGGSALRAGIVSFAQQHNDYYKEAIMEGSMSSAEAAQFALTAGTVNAFIEAAVGGLESRPLAAAGKVGINETKALTGLLDAKQYAKIWLKDRGKTIGKDILEENSEEILQALGDSAIKADFNQRTGAKMDDGMTADEVKETLLLTTVVTAPISVMGGGGDITSYQKNALAAAVSAPEKFKKTLDILVEGGMLDAVDATAAMARVESLAQKKANLPAETKAKDDFVVLEYAREKLEEISEASNVSEAQKQAAKEEISKIDAAQKAIISPEEAQADQEEMQTPEEANPFAYPVTIKKPEVGTVEDQDVTEAVTRAEQAGTPVPASIQEVVADSEAPFSVVTQAIETVNQSLDENRAEVVIDRYIDEITQSVIDQVGRIRDVDPEEFSIIREQVKSSIDQAPDGSYVDVVSGIANQYMGNETVQGNLSQRLDVQSAMDDIADFFASGGKIARTGADWMMSKGVQKDQKGMMLKYFSNSSNMKADQLAQIIADRWGISEADAQQMIADFVQENPNGPGEYIKSRLEPAENPDEVVVDEFFDQFKGEQGIDYDAVATEIMNNGEAYASLPESAKGLINEAIGTIQEDSGEPGATNQSDESQDQQTTEGEDTSEPITSANEPTESQEEVDETSIDSVERAINNLPVTTETAPIDIEAVRSTTNDRALIEALANIENEPLSEEQIQAVKQARLNSSIDFGDVTPFQHASKETAKGGDINATARKLNRGTGKMMKKIIGRVAQAFPNIQIVTNRQEVIKALPEGISMDDVKGFVKDGVVYINMDKAGIDTPIHEIGHIWTMWAREAAPGQYAKGLDLVKDSAYHNAVKNDPFYAGLNEEQQLEEALAIAIGEKGALFETSTRWSKFKQWMTELWGTINRALGFDASATTLHTFATQVSKDITSGQPISSITAQKVQSIRNKMKTHPVFVDGQFQFVGVKSNVAKQVYGKLSLAKFFETIGKDDDTIWAATGWYRGVDGMWRYEINTDDVYVKTPWPEMAKRIAVQDGRITEDQSVTEAVFRLDELVDHPTLFAAYPQLRDMEVRYTDQIDHGAIDENRNLLISTKSPFTKEVLVHEMQHSIQDIEAFASGTNVGDAAYIGTHLIQKAVSMYNEATTKEEEVAALEMLQNLQKFIIDGSAVDGLGLYMASAGEVEARLAGARATKMIQSPGWTMKDGDSVNYKGLEYYYQAPWFNKDKHIFESPEDVRRAMDGEPARIASREEIPPYTMYDVAPEHQVVFTITEENQDILTSHPGTVAFQTANAQAQIKAAQDAARQIIKKEINDNGQKNATTTIKKISQEFNLDYNSVAETWAQESEAVGFGKLDYTKAEPAFKPPAIKERIGKWLKKYFTSDGILGPELMAEVRAFENNISAHIKKIDLIMKDFDRAVDEEAKSFDKKENGRKHFRQLADNVLKGEADINMLPESLRPIVADMRQTIDNMSREIVKIGAGNNKFSMTILANAGVDLGLATDAEKSDVAKALATSPNDRTIDQNIMIEKFLQQYGTKAGTYLYRSYQVNDDPNWAVRVDKTVIDRAKARIISDIDNRIAELIDIRDSKIEPIQEKIDQEKEKIKAIEQGLADSIDQYEQKLSDLIDKQSKYRAEFGRSNKNLSASIESTRKKLAEVKTRLRQSRNIINEDILTLMMMPTDELNGLRFAARSIAGARRRIQKMEEKIEAIKSFTPDAITQLEAQKVGVDGIIESIINKDKAPVGLVSKSMPGSKDLSSMNARKDIPEEIRALMGEYNDARINFAKSATRMAHLIESQQLLLRMRNKFEGQFFFPPGTPVPGYYRKIAGDGSKAMAPLNGWYTSPDILNELTEIYDASDRNWPTWLKAWFAMVSSVRYGKTILSPVTHVRNIVSNLYLAAIHGHYDLTKPGFGIKDAAIAIAGKFSTLSKEERRNEVLKLTKLGILGSGTSSEVLREGLQDITSFGPDWAVSGQKLSDMAAGNKIDQLMAGSVRAVGKTLKTAENMYQIEDDFFKALGFYKEQARYSKAWFNKKYDELTAQQKEEVDSHAANVVQNVLPTYDRVPKVVSTFLRGWPITGTFVAFPAEMFRTSKNTIYLIRDELKDARTRNIGFTRLASVIGWQATIFAAAYYLRAANGVDDEEDAAIRSFSKPWLKDATLMHTGEKNGIYSFYNLSYTDPHSFFKEFYWTVATDTGEKIHERLGTAFVKLFDPFVSENLVWSTARQAISNQNDYNHADIYNTALPWKEWVPVVVDSQGVRTGANFGDLSRFLAWSLQPGFVKTYQDVKMASTGETISGRSPKSMTQVLSSFAGLQKEEFDPVKQVNSHIRLRGKQRQDARNEFNSKVKEIESLQKRGLLKNKQEKLGELKSSFELSALATAQLSEVILDDIERARKIGVTNAELYNALQDAGFTQEERILLLTGNQFTPKFKGYNK